jgi:hypothetical protein
MAHNAPTSSAQTSPPDPNREAAGASPPPNVGRLLRIVRTLVVYGQLLTAALQLHAATPRFPALTAVFGTTNLAAILARIACGLRRAAALEGRLNRAAARGRDVTPPPFRLDAPRACAAAPRPKREAAPAIPGLPSAEQIAAEVRRRPIGAVLVDICCDLGIAPGQCDRAFWDELSLAIIEFGGSTVRWIKDLGTRLKASWDAHVAQSPAAEQGLELPALPEAIATGPPWEPFTLSLAA